jgi:replicative DNA helicase
VDIVREKSRLRELIMVMQYGSNAAYEQDNVDAIIGQVESDLLELLRKGRRFTQRSIKDIAADTLSNLSRLRKASSACIGLHTGLAQMDKATTGYRAGEYYVIGARPAQGKSSLCCQSIRANCKAGKKCGLFSIEMTEEQVMLRLVAMETGIDITDLRDPRRLDDQEMLKINYALASIAEWPLFIDDSSRITIQELNARARMFISRGVEAIYVDYLQRIKAPGDSQFDRVTAVSEGLCELAKSSKVPVIALSQLRRSEQGNNAPPSLDDLRASGQIEQDAHGVFLLWRPRKGSNYTGEDEIILAKQRDGPSGGHVNVYFHGPTGKFEPREVVHGNE